MGRCDATRSGERKGKSEKAKELENKGPGGVLGSNGRRCGGGCGQKSHEERKSGQYRSRNKSRCSNLTAVRDTPLVQDFLDAKAILLEFLRRRHNACGILSGQGVGGSGEMREAKRQVSHRCQLVSMVSGVKE